MPDLEHLTAFEHPEDHQGRDDHEDKGEDPGPGRGAEPPEVDVHSEEAGYQGRRHEHQGHEGEHLHDLVLVEVDDTEDCVLQIFKTLKAEVGVIDERGDVLQEHIQTGLILLRIVRALENTGDNPLLVDDVLTDEHRILLQEVDVDEEFLADVFSHTHLTVVLVDLLRHELHHVGIEVDTLFEDSEEDDVT